MGIGVAFVFALAAVLPSDDHRVRHISADESGRWVVVWDATHLLSRSRLWGPVWERSVRVSMFDVRQGLSTFRLFTVPGDANVGDYRVLDVAITDDRAAVLLTQGGYTWLLTARRMVPALPSGEWHAYGRFRDFTDGDGSLGPAATRGEVTIVTDRFGEPHATVRLEASDGSPTLRTVRVRPPRWGK
jgi:hypothetical protein